MKWIEYKEYQYLKEGTVCGTNEGDFILVGEISTACGYNDEFPEEITHYTEHFCDNINDMIQAAKTDFKLI